MMVMIMMMKLQIVDDDEKDDWIHRGSFGKQMRSNAILGNVEQIIRYIKGRIASLPCADFEPGGHTSSGSGQIQHHL